MIGQLIPEIVWVDGDTSNLFVIFRFDRKDSSHYFYFPAEPQKLVDIEPMRSHSITLQGGKFHLVFSRVHYWGLAIWINPDLHSIDGENRPVCNFSSLVHTPRVLTKQTNYWPGKEGRISDSQSLSPIEKISWGIATTTLAAGLWRLSTSKPAPYPSIVTEVKPEVIADPNQRFDDKSIISSCRYVFFLGVSLDISAVKQALMDSSGKITLQKLEQFLSSLGPL